MRDRAWEIWEILRFSSLVLSIITRPRCATGNGNAAATAVGFLPMARTRFTEPSYGEFADSGGLIFGTFRLPYFGQCEAEIGVGRSAERSLGPPILIVFADFFRLM